MSSLRDQFGGGNAKLDGLSNKILTQVTVNVIAWAIDPAEIAVGTPLVAAFAAAWAISKIRQTSTAVDRETTKLAKAAMLLWLRSFVKKWIYLNTAMTSADIISCGLKPHETVRTPIGTPGSKPEATYQVTAGGFHTVSGFYRQQPDEEGVSRRGKPKNVRRAVVVYIILDAAADLETLEPDDFPKTVAGTRSPVKIIFKAADAGKTAALAMCWETDKGLRGDWSPVQTITVP